RPRAGVPHRWQRPRGRRQRTARGRGHFDGSMFFTADFLVVAGTGGWFWTSAHAPGPLQPLAVPNTAANNLPPAWAFPLSWRVTLDRSTAYFPVGGDPLAARGEMDVYRLTNAGGVP